MEEAEFANAPQVIALPSGKLLSEYKPVWKEFITAVSFFAKLESKTRGKKASREEGATMSQATAANVTIKNTNRWPDAPAGHHGPYVRHSPRCRRSVRIPILPAAPFLTYDPSLMPAMVCGFAFGPGAGFAVGAVAAIIHSLMLGEWVGGLMNICATLFFVRPPPPSTPVSAHIRRPIIGLLVGCVVATIGAVAANLTIGVWFWYGSADVIMPLILPAVLPFNLIKTVLNSVLTLLVVQGHLQPRSPRKKDQIKGR